jgi:YgiT-type zinc finger domain-containing protein
VDNAKATGGVNVDCIHCGHSMVESVTTFTVVRNRLVYLTEGVPCWECSVCGHISFSQDVAKRLEFYSSGRAGPQDTSYKVLTFRWDAPMVEFKQPRQTEGYVMAKLVVPGTVTYPLSLPK